MSEVPAPAREGQAPALRLPDPLRLFERRAARLDALAHGHAAPEWLLLLARVAAGQARAVTEIRPAAPAPCAGRPLAYGELRRDESWRRMLALVVDAARTPGLPVRTQEALRRIGESGVPDLERLADGVLAGAVEPDDRACAPFVGAALQAWLTALAAGIDPATAPAPEGACPVCGGPPVAAIVQAVDRLRYVTCAVCSSEWNVPRIRCVACETSVGPEYFQIEAERGLKVEACPTCRTYVKLFDEEKRPGAEAAADDAATIALDLLVSEEGFHRAGSNLYVGATSEG